VIDYGGHDLRALVYDGELSVVDDYPSPAPSADEVVIDVRLAGICSTDIEITRGYMDFTGVLGHEFVGVVASAGGAAGRQWVGRRVVAEINCVCGQCEMCLAGLKTHCLRRTTLGIDRHDGCMADQIVVPAANLCAVPDSVPDEAAVFVEPLSAAFQIMQQVRPGSKDKTVVIGDGRLGQLIAQVLTSRGIRPLVIGLNEHKLRRLERLGVSCLPASEARPRRDAQLVIEASGSTSGFRTAMAFVRPRGTIVLKSTLASEEPLNLTQIVVDEITVQGSRCGPFGEALSALTRNEIDLDGLVTAEFPLTDGVRAMEAAQKPDALKVLVRP
jgi:threonine dehydrogenase-like Zn-dependent dehydrogenase